VASSKGRLISAYPQQLEALLASNLRELLGDIMRRVEVSVALRLCHLTPRPAKDATQATAHTICRCNAAVESGRPKAIVLSKVIPADNLCHLFCSLHRVVLSFFRYPIQDVISGGHQTGRFFLRLCLFRYDTGNSLLFGFYDSLPIAMTTKIAKHVKELILPKPTATSKTRPFGRMLTFSTKNADGSRGVPSPLDIMVSVDTLHLLWWVHRTQFLERSTKYAHFLGQQICFGSD
jgi:hypothetical protein